MSIKNFVKVGAITLAIAALPTAVGVTAAARSYHDILQNALNEDFIEATGTVLDDGFKCYKKTEEGKDYLVADVVAKDGTVWSMVWDATGHEYRSDGFYSNRDAAKIIESEDPTSVERYDYNQEM